MARKFFIKTLGCKVNQYESQTMRESLVRAGYAESSSDEDADLYIVNTCTVTNQADSESRRIVRRFHRKNGKAEIVVVGCSIENEPDAEVFSTLPGVSYLIKNSEKWRIADILDESAQGRYPAPSSAQESTISDFKGRAKAFVKVQDGCSERCSYCRVSLVRGPLKSKSLSAIRGEVKALSEKGFQEIVLTGICLGAWGLDIGENGGIVEILKALDGVRADHRIRLSSIELKYITPGLIDLIASRKDICKHLHIPLQSGDDDILKKMKRSYTAEAFTRAVERIRLKDPKIGITTDCIVGFPGETEANFNNTVAVIKETLPVRVHIFPYSRREGTPAAGFEDVIDGNVVRARLNRLRVAALGSSYIFRERFLNTRLKVLVETARERDSGMLEGYSDNYIKILFKGSDKLMGTVVPVIIEHLTLEKTIGQYQGIR
ncbi:tRNA (N(6)-L-threonylcarbamoyladenosine(37)-C(2))-methylthiotransferase MtaB [Candidatus Omnitrophota bacterium]